ncbi:NifB/NifX family molybdenum-iron cluster-binding protein [Teredinibacter turnerae]|uniref:NifB/NifX family molybdenum-iron cluster-binding protein n=1 Tax=Teredinibacter turnerae TaxID=2426 RepID=UPI0030CF223F
MAEQPLQKLAVASKDGISINLHFGHSDTFWIYTVSGKEIALLEKREVDKYCHGHTGSQSAMQKILATINDCTAVFSAKIGDGPTEKLRKIGVFAVSDYAYEAVEESLLAYVNDR